MNPHSEILPSVVEAIGETPLVELSRIARNVEGRLLIKLEYLNPGLSKKDRVARQIVEDARADGSLRAGQTIVELTSGNTGTGLAIVCAVLGHPFVAVMSRGNSPERARMMKALGAEVILVEQEPGSTKGEVSGDDLRRVDAVATRITADRCAFRADQFRNFSNFRAHYLHTGPEVLRQTKNEIDAFCDFVGTGGTFAGCAAAFKEKKPGIECFVIEPKGAAVLETGKVANKHHPIQGGGYAMAELSLLNRAHVDGYISVSGIEAIATARRLAREEALFAGFSTGANVAAALRLMGKRWRGKTVVTVASDSGLKYLSSRLWR